MSKNTNDKDPKGCTAEDKNTDTFLENADKIEKTVSYYIKKHGEFPSVSYLSKATGLHRVTISKHLKKMNLKEGVLVFRTSTNKVMDALTQKSLKGDVSAIRLWFQIVYNWVEPRFSDGEKATYEPPVINISTHKDDPPVNISMN
jgi:biotin operon repressor